MGAEGELARNRASCSIIFAGDDDRGAIAGDGDRFRRADRNGTGGLGKSRDGVLREPRLSGRCGSDDDANTEPPSRRTCKPDDALPLRSGCVLETGDGVSGGT